MSEKKYTLNRVEGFNPYEQLTEMYDSLGNPCISTLTGQNCRHLRVDAKKTWFRKMYPEGATTLEIIENDDVSVTVKACVYKTTDTDQLPLGCGFSSQDKVGSRTYPPLESAATIALGNALEDAGFGCEVMQELFKEETAMRNAAGDGINLIFDGVEEKTADKDENRNEPVEIKPVSSASGEVSEDIFASMGIKVQHERKEEIHEEKIAEESVENTDTSTLKEDRHNEDVSESIKAEDAVNDALSYVIREEDNITGSTLFEPYIGKALKDIDPKTLKLMREKLTTVMSEKLIFNIDQLVS